MLARLETFVLDVGKLLSDTKCARHANNDVILRVHSVQENLFLSLALEHNLRDMVEKTLEAKYLKLRKSKSEMQKCTV
jgi:hypothetical protein